MSSDQPRWREVVARYRERLQRDLVVMNLEQQRRRCVDATFTEMSRDAEQSDHTELPWRPVVYCPVRHGNKRKAIGHVAYATGGGIIFEARVEGRPDDVPLRLERTPAPSSDRTLGYFGEPGWEVQERRLAFPIAETLSLLDVAGPTESIEADEASIPVIRYLYGINAESGLRVGPNPGDPMNYDRVTVVRDFLDVPDSIADMVPAVELPLYARCKDHAGSVNVMPSSELPDDMRDAAEKMAAAHGASPGPIEVEIDGPDRHERWHLDRRQLGAVARGDGEYDWNAT
jgi:hypothetical protein